MNPSGSWRGSDNSLGRFLSSAPVQGTYTVTGSSLPEMGISPKGAARISIFSFSFLVYPGQVFYFECPLGQWGAAVGEV